MAEKTEWEAICAHARGDADYARKPDRSSKDAEAALDAFERLLTYGRRPEGAGTTFKFNPGFFFLSDIDADTIRSALSAASPSIGMAREKGEQS